MIRRFRNTPEVKADLRNHVPPRRLERRSFPISAKEDEAYRMIADLRLDIDEEEGRGKRSGMRLFRTTLAKAIFSSPMACLETVEGRLSRMRSGTPRGTPSDAANLEALRDILAQIGAEDFEKYRELLRYLKESGWKGRDPRDRIVIFSERIRTVSWLEERLKADLGLDDEAIGRVDGSAVNDDERMQKTLEDFGQKPAKIRILLASDMASEGLNLHFQCSRLIHFDLPWSLIRFQQRNGRIDRYGQDREPVVTYFVGESSHPQVRDMWVLEKLVEKDKAAQEGAGDPAVFLGVGDADLEEEVVAEAIASGMGPEAFGALMDANAAEASRHEGAVEAGEEEEDLAALLFGEYGDAEDGRSAPAISGSDASLAPGAETAPPRLFEDTFSYTAAALMRLTREDQRRLRKAPEVNEGARVIRFELPDDLRATDNFGYSSGDKVDERYMPHEAVRADTIRLTDDLKTMNTAIEQARTDERAWPDVQYLWDVHPILGWLNDSMEQLFGRRAAPVCRIPGALEKDEVAVILHGTVSNRVGGPLVDSWGVVRVKRHDVLSSSVSEVGDVEDFLSRIGLKGKVPNVGGADMDLARQALEHAVSRFQDHLVALRQAKARELKVKWDGQRPRIEALRERFDRKIQLDFGGLMGIPTTLQERRRERRRQEREHDVERMFRSWNEWYRDTCEVVVEPNPYVDVKAVFQG